MVGSLKAPGVGVRVLHSSNFLDEIEPVEVWLVRAPAMFCEVFYHDIESNREPLVAQCLAGAQREITRRLIRQGFAPVERWQTFGPTLGIDDCRGEWRRRFAVDDHIGSRGTR